MSKSLLCPSGSVAESDCSSSSMSSLSSGGKGFRSLDFGRGPDLVCAQEPVFSTAPIQPGEIVSNNPLFGSNSLTQVLAGSGLGLTGSGAAPAAFPYAAASWGKMAAFTASLFPPPLQSAMAEEVEGMLQPEEEHFFFQPSCHFSDMYEDWLCWQTQPARQTPPSPQEAPPTHPPSRFRLAAETLAKSNLNPNAEVFTPKKTDVSATRTSSLGSDAVGLFGPESMTDTLLRLSDRLDSPSAANSFTAPHVEVIDGSRRDAGEKGPSASPAPFLNRR